MSSETRYADYDAFADRFDDNGTESYQNLVEYLEKMILHNLPKGASIFDLCCGTGQVAKLLLRKGYQVTGLDGSEKMLHYARENAPRAEFILGDARFFKLPPTFHAVISTDVSLRHVMSLEELEAVFHNVYAAVLEGGWFTFDLTMEERFQSTWNGSIRGGKVKDDYVLVNLSSYDPKNKVGRDNYIQFRLIEGKWQRSDVTMLSKAYSTAEVKSALKKVGFTDISVYDEERDLGATGMAGIACFICRKPQI